MSSCKTCYWDYNGDCVSEILDEIAEDASFESCNCIGWLRKDYEEHFYNTYEQVLELLLKRNCTEIEAILKFVKNQRPETCTHSSIILVLKTQRHDEEMLDYCNCEK